MNIRMSTKGKRPMRSLTPSDKIHAIQRIHDGESKASVARDIGVPESTLRGWCKNEDKLRFMSRQSAADKMSTDALSEKLDSASALLGGPPEKRQKVDNSLPLNFSNKMKYDELGYKRSPLNGLDFSTNKGLADLSFNGLAPDYASFNGSTKNKGYGADITRQNDPSMAAISPLSSLSHLSGLTGLSHSPLAISFNELTSNLNLLAQLNPGLAAMSGLNGLASTANQLRNVKPKAPPQMHSPRSEGSDRQQGLSVKNWAKQKTPISSSNEHNFGLNLTQSDAKSKMKCPSPSLAPSLGNNMPMPAMPDDPLLYWLKSQQAMLGLNSLYPPPPPPPIGSSSPPIRSSTPQQIPLASTPLTPSSTPSGSLDDKNSAWFNWCKAFGASLTSLAPTAVAAVHPMLQPATSTTMEGSNTNNNQKPPYENILYSHLTKDTSSPSVHSSSSVDNMHNEIINNTDSTGKPEDLSAKSIKTSSTPPSPLPTPAHSPIVSAQSPSVVPSREQSPILSTDAQQSSERRSNEGGGVADCKDVLDNLLFKINSNNPNTSLSSTATPISNEAVSDSDASYNGDSLHNNNDLNTTNNNNNNNSNKTDEEEKAKCAELLGPGSTSDDIEAIQHGEKFLKWLENCSNPRVTAVQLMQLRFLISAIKSGNTGGDQKLCSNEDHNNTNTITEPETVTMIDETTEEGSRTKLRRRK